jgi:selenocysteine lyase/cysteine desulfurase
VLEDAREIVRYRLARLAELPAEEVAIMRNTTEALNNVTMGIPLQPGDEIVLANQDYPNMKKAWQNRAEREGLVLRWVDLPMPSEDPDVLAQPYIEAFSERTKVVNITHMVHWTGQVMPVRRIADAARARGIWSIGDCSHSFCQIPYRIRELGTDFAGTSLHKWLCAPFGTGMLWMRQEHIGKIFPLFLHRDHEPRGTDIRKFEGQGTRAYAAELAIGHAIDFHEGLGTELKHARLCYLKSYWAEQAMQRIPGLRLHTPLSHNFSGSLGLIYFEGRKMDIYSIEQRLDQEYGIHTVAFEAPGVWGLRVSVHIFTQLGELDQFVDALATLCAEEDHAAAS